MWPHAHPRLAIGVAKADASNIGSLTDSYVSKLIAEEFQFCGRDENRMRKIHSNNMDCIGSLCMSIRRSRKIRKGNLQSRQKETDAEDVERDDDGHEEEEEEEADEDEPLTRKRKGMEDDNQTLSKSRPSRIQPRRVKKSCP